MKTNIKITLPFIMAFMVLLLVNCNTASSDSTIVGRYESTGDTADQKIVYHITHINDNLYGIKVEASFNGSETQTDYLEGSYNPEERMLATKRSNVVLSYKFSSDFKTIELLGDENPITLHRK